MILLYLLCTMLRASLALSGLKELRGADAAEHSRGQGCAAGVVFQGADCAAGAYGTACQWQCVWMLCDLAMQCMAGSADSSCSVLL